MEKFPSGKSGPIVLHALVESLEIEWIQVQAQWKKNASTYHHLVQLRKPWKKHDLCSALQEEFEKSYKH